MSKEKAPRSRGVRSAPQVQTQELVKSFSQKNLVLFLVALIVIVIGHVSLGMGSITLAPICLVLGYCVLVPLAIIL